MFIEVIAYHKESLSYTNTNPFFLAPGTLDRFSSSDSSRRNSVRSNHSCKSNRSSTSTLSAVSENQCSDPQQILKFGKNLSSVWPILSRSPFLGILSAVFAFYAATVLGSVLLMIFAIWLS